VGDFTMLHTRVCSYVLLCLAAILLTLSPPLAAQSETDAWLRYAPLDSSLRTQYQSLPSVVYAAGDSDVIRNARYELERGLRGMLSRSMREASGVPREPAIILGLLPALRAADPFLPLPKTIPPEGFSLVAVPLRGAPSILITAADDRGVLYGTFALLRLIATGHSLDQLQLLEEPAAPIRWVNQWDNLNGTIERGYGGPSIFFENGSVRPDLTRAGQFARLLASLGINGCAINNVNADPRILSPDFIPQLARVAAAFRPWGVKLGVAVDFASPKSTPAPGSPGTLDTFDPLDPRVVKWWQAKADEIYRAIPDFGGFVVKADSEGRSGPSAYNRTQSDAANVIARALRPHGGILFYRAFVYDHHLDWRNPKNDRARAAADVFHPLDGRFDSNVVLQIKNGPIDFQVREPVSPLLGALEKTSEAVELQITQEYLGQARQLVFLAPMWKAILDFDMHAAADATPVKSLVAGRVFHQSLGGFIGVSNVGADANWSGNVLSPANLYAFGRLAWNPDLDAQQIAAEWTRLTFGNDPRVAETIVAMQLGSWAEYEGYTGPLGAGTLTDITGNHYGPSVEASERNGWGQWHRADSDGIGMDRTVATGTGFIGQYRPEVARRFESLDDCPDELLLFFHHVAYTHRLHSGLTVIQHVYDSHYLGAQIAEENVLKWQSLHGSVDEPRYSAILHLLEYQAGAAEVWRDAICNWFKRESGIADDLGRVGNHPGRVEAEAMTLSGYSVVDVTPWEAASAGKAVECPRTATGCEASLKYPGVAGVFDVDVEYFDTNNGVAKFKFFVAGKLLDEWVAGNTLPTTKLDGSSSVRRRIHSVALQPGDEIRIGGIPDGGDRAALDYIQIHYPIK
jgi:alpha-glucuronidase